MLGLLSSCTQATSKFLNQSISSFKSISATTSTSIGIQPNGLVLDFKRWATKKAGATTKNGRTPNPKYRGLKKGNGEMVWPGHILVRQVGSKYLPGIGTSCGKDWTVVATVPGLVTFEKIKKKHKEKTVIHVLTREEHEYRRMKKALVLAQQNPKNRKLWPNFS